MTGNRVPVLSEVVPILNPGFRILPVFLESVVEWIAGCRTYCRRAVKCRILNDPNKNNNNNIISSEEIPNRLIKN